MTTPIDSKQQQVRFEQSRDDWTNGILFDAPESWDGEESADSIALDYVATLEKRLDNAGISREKWIEEPC